MNVIYENVKLQSSRLDSKLEILIKRNKSEKNFALFHSDK